jgi:hypothetical protein
MIVLNPIWEKEKIPSALRELVKNLSVRCLFSLLCAHSVHDVTSGSQGISN